VGGVVLEHVGLSMVVSGDLAHAACEVMLPLTA
jgi:hypothetical protein